MCGFRVTVHVWGQKPTVKVHAYDDQEPSNAQSLAGIVLTSTYVSHVALMLYIFILLFGDETVTGVHFTNRAS